MFPLFLIQDVILLLVREAVEQQTKNRSQKLCPTLLGLILHTINKQKLTKSRAEFHHQVRMANVFLHQPSFKAIDFIFKLRHIFNGKTYYL